MSDEHERQTGTGTRPQGDPVDLAALRIEQQADDGAPVRRPWRTRLAPALLLLLLAGALATFVVPWLAPRTPVRTAAVRVAADGDGAAPRTAATEAAGWVEPEPFAVLVRPRVAGVVAELAVLPGDRVEAGVTTIARLDDAPFRLAREAAAAEVALREARLAEAGAAERGARVLLEQRAAPRAEARAAEARLAGTDARLAGLRAGLEAARARRGARATELARLERLAADGVDLGVDLARARAEHAAAVAAARARAEEVEAAIREREATARAVALAREVEEHPRELEVAAERATARRSVAEAELARARTAHGRAERELAWTEVPAPVDGVVLRVLGPPGSAAGPTGGSGYERGPRGAIVALYDPARLQVRVDVPLGEIDHVQVGQRAEIRSEVLGNRAVGGTVTRVEHESDLLKNTLQVKVHLAEPHPRLVPETLCRVRFLVPDRGPADGAAAPERFLVPEAAVRDGAVFVLDPRDGGRARRVEVETLGERDGSVLVRGALSPSQSVILDAVSDGQAVEEGDR